MHDSEANAGSYALKTLADIFKRSLKEMYYAENMLVPALRRIADAAINDQLKVVIEEHIEETTKHVELLRRVCPLIGTIADGEKCLAIEGLMEQADVLLKDASEVALNAGLLAACQSIEHYEISRYGTLREWARILGYEEAHSVLTRILDEERAANSKLTNLAIRTINML